MMKSTIGAIMLLFWIIPLIAQEDLNFGSSAGRISFSGDIVNAESSGANLTYTQSFDVYDEISNDFTTGGGVDDITLEFTIIETYDAYGQTVINTRAGSSHDVTQNSSGLRSGVPIGGGQSGTKKTTTGDVRGTDIKVTFASHIEVLAGQIKVLLSGVNTTGESYESTAIVWLDENGNEIGVATYTGFYDETTTLPSGLGGSGVGSYDATPWSLTTAYAADNIGAIDMTDPLNPTSGSSSSTNNNDPSPTDVGISATTRIGGFIFKYRVEDVANTASEGIETTTSANPSATLNGIDFTGIVLPVTLSAFSGELSENGEVDLTWNTTSEYNNAYFQVERSTDRIDFQSIGQVIGKGTTTITQTYHFEDHHPNVGKNYYRLKQVDIDGSFSYSDIIEISNQVLGATTVKIFPNPTNDFITLQAATIGATVQVFNVFGHLMEMFSVTDTVHHYDCSHLPSGIYFFKTSHITKKVIKK